ncbi:MAG: nucleoside recognition domain-containing protein [Bacteroidales bacterium]|nr:nucleoside recognition domain-containing protein [Bacteroidales bacterium]
MHFRQHLINAFRKSSPKAFRTALWLLKIILPISFAVRLLQYFGVIGRMAEFVQPLFSQVGLPGESAIVFITSIFSPLYAPLAVLSSLSLDMREITILALMCLISHNMIVECSVQAKTGSSWGGIFVFRLVMSFVIAAFLNYVLPYEGYREPLFIWESHEVESFGEMIKAWFISSMTLTGILISVVFGLMFLHRLLEELCWLQKIAKRLEPLMLFFGLPRNSAFMWLVGNVVGLTYGGAIMMDAIENKDITFNESRRLNLHLAVSHSMIEDTLIFVSVGVSVGWILCTRLFFAFCVVWFVRLMTYIYRTQLNTLRIK